MTKLLKHILRKPLPQPFARDPDLDRKILELLGAS
jgi:hypothetical protein